MAKVVFTKPAEYDLLDIEHYIFTELCNPQAAQRVTDGILKTVESLKEHPMKHAVVQDSLLKRVGLRLARFGNYNIFYYYNLDSDMIYIIRILYNRVDWHNILKD